MLNPDTTRERGLLRALAAAATLALAASGCSVVGAAAAPGDDGEVVIAMGDYAFDPGTVRVTAGQTVTFVLSNEGGHAHEFMIGRDPVIYDDYLSNPFADAFEVDFFEGLDVSFEGAGMPMNFAGMPEMDMDEMDMGEMEDMEDMGESGEMGEMGEMGESSPEMDMEDGGEEHAEETTDAGEGHAEDADSASEEDHDDEAADDGGSVVVEPDEEDHAEEEGEAGHAEEEGEAAHGGMVMLDTEEGGRLTVTIPEDRVGTWTIGCFQEEGGHFVDGMQATLIVAEA